MASSRRYQQWLSSALTLHDDLRRQVIIVLLDLSASSGALPHDLFIKGVTIGSDRDPSSGGGFADIFLGRYQGKDVAIKRFRIFDEQSRERINTVCLFIPSLWCVG
jgi:hypothetical protein